MFFIGIFGIENKQKEVKQLENIYCKTCSTRTMGTLIKSYEYFHIFFIPIFRWNEKYYVMCKRCNSIYEISKEKGKAIENRRCPKAQTSKCMNCKPFCHITTGFSGAGAFSDGKLSLSYEVGGNLPELIGAD